MNIRHEARIDTEIAAAWSAWSAADRKAKTRRKSADTYAARKNSGTTEAALRSAVADEAEDAATELWLAYAEAAKQHTGWSRFFLVAGGHIHRSLHCSTCNNGERPTQFGWLPELSGLTEADAVAAHGAILCTVCFPTAPTEWTNHYEEAAKAKAAARCSGSGSYLNRDLPNRTGYYSGNWGTCEVCGERPTVTSTGKLRAHRAK